MADSLYNKRFAVNELLPKPPLFVPKVPFTCRATAEDSPPISVLVVPDEAKFVYIVVAVAQDVATAALSAYSLAPLYN